MVQVAWVPGWYELDPLLEVGLEGEFAFWRVVPEHLRGTEEHVLYSDLWQPGDAMFASGKIIGIRHAALGDIRKVDTCGLDYTITLADGTEILVNAEEDPGKMFEGKPGAWVESKRIVSQWRFAVEFESLSQFSPEPKCNPGERSRSATGGGAMTEADWIRSDDPAPMLAFLQSRASEQELRSFCLACCRRVWNVMPPAGRRAVEVAERHLSGQATDADLDAANAAVGDLCERGAVSGRAGFAANAAFHASFWRCEVEEAEDCSRNSVSAGLDRAEVADLLRQPVGSLF